jgi:DNA replication and repair protein RecF
MHLTALELIDFRSYVRAMISFEPGVNLIVGANGQGKTNLLEAIGLLSVGRSIRGANDADMVKWNAETALIDGQIAENGGTRLTMRLRPGQAKDVSIDGAPLATLSELVGMLRTVHMTPDTIDQGFRSPSGRRRMLDMLISQVDRAYLDALKRHRQIVTNVNALCKWIGDAPSSAREAEIEVWERQLAEVAVEIGRRRAATVDALNTAAQTRYAALFDDAQLELRLRSSLPFETESDGERVSDADRVDTAARVLAAGRDRAVRSGFVTRGAHRDKLEVLINGRDIESHASQGQIKGAYYAWKLAEGDVIASETGHEPVWLVDDPFSEMDRERALSLLDAFRERGQVLLTTARDEDLGLDRFGFAIWRVHNGTLEPVT